MSQWRDPEHSSKNKKKEESIVSVLLTRWRSSSNMSMGIASTDADMPTTNMSSNLLYIKFRPVENVTFFKHWFIDVNNTLRWHPGNTTSSKIFEPISLVDPNNKLGKDVLVKIHEMCDDCLCEFFEKRFNLDRIFNIFYLNCEIIVGFCLQTILTICTVFFLIIFPVTRKWIFFILFLMFFAILAVCQFCNTTNEVQFTVCKHIITNLQNITYKK